MGENHNHSESKINSLIGDYMKEMKEEFIKTISGFANVNNGELSADKYQEVLTMIQKYPKLTLREKDYMKRKRVKTNVPLYEKCMAKRANGEQCSRRKKNDSGFCGTHSKGCPHGVVNANGSGGATHAGDAAGSFTDENGTTNDGLVKKQVQVWLEDINGIMYWIDDSGSVYDTGDIMKSVENPRVIAKYEKNMEGDSEVYKVIGEVR